MTRPTVAVHCSFSRSRPAELKDGVNEKATLQDIAENPKNFKFQEVEAAQVPRTLDDVDAAIINSNFAMQVQLDPTKDSLFIEDSTSPYVNIVAVRQAMRTVLRSRHS